MQERNITIRYVEQRDISFLLENDHHLSESKCEEKIAMNEIILAVGESNQPIGWLRFNYFWDEIPFMNLLMVASQYRGKGIGREIVTFWEESMSSRGHNLIMTSTLSNENAQYFYRKLGYKDSGSLLLEQEPLEIIFTKKLDI